MHGRKRLQARSLLPPPPPLLPLLWGVLGALTSMAANSSRIWMQNSCLSNIRWPRRLSSAATNSTAVRPPLSPRHSLSNVLLMPSRLRADSTRRSCASRDRHVAASCSFVYGFGGRKYLDWNVPAADDILPRAVRVRLGRDLLWRVRWR